MKYKMFVLGIVKAGHVLSKPEYPIIQEQAPGVVKKCH